MISIIEHISLKKTCFFNKNQGYTLNEYMLI